MTTMVYPSTKWYCDIEIAFNSATFSYFYFILSVYCFCEDIAHPVSSCSYFDTQAEVTSSDFSQLVSRVVGSAPAKQPPKDK